MEVPRHHLLLLLMVLILFRSAAASILTDTASLREFRRAADPNGLLNDLWVGDDVCKWEGVECKNERVEKVRVPSLPLGGVFVKGTLDTMDQVRVLQIIDCGLKGNIPDLKKMLNLKQLLLSGNSFTGPFPQSVIDLRRLLVIDVSNNRLSGTIPDGVRNIPLLGRFLVQNNNFSGVIPPLNQTTLNQFNVSGNNLSGEIPKTKSLQNFTAISFSDNPGLCGSPLAKPCPVKPIPPAHTPTPTAAAAAPPNSPVKGKKKGLTDGEIVAIVVGCVAVVWVALLVCCFCNNRRQKRREAAGRNGLAGAGNVDRGKNGRFSDVGPRFSLNKSKSQMDIPVLVFCRGETPRYTLEDLLRASAEVLGRGTLGTTYKAMTEFMLIVAVKRLRFIKGSRHEFENYVESLGELRHENLVPLRAYFQAKEERLIVYEYQPTGSLQSLIYSNHTGRGIPLHLSDSWKIAIDMARGLCYLHQGTKFLHGNLKPTNVLLGAHSEARLVDYGLMPFHGEKMEQDQELAIYKAPEQNSHNSIGQRTDVYSYGVVLLEMLTGEAPGTMVLSGSPSDMCSWARRTRQEGLDSSAAAFDSQFPDKFEALVNIAVLCVSFAPNERPTINGVLSMLEEGWDPRTAGEGSARYSASDHIFSSSEAY